LTLARLIEELSRARAAALLVDEPASEADARLADDLGLPVFIGPAGADLRALEREALRALLDRDAPAVRREAEVRQRYQALLASGGLRAVVRDLALTTGAAVTVEDAEGQSLAVEGGASRGGDECSFPIRAAGRPLGRLVLRNVAWEGAPDLALAGVGAAEACALAMLQRAARLEAREELADDALAELLRPDADEALVRARLQRLGFDGSPGRRLLALAVFGADAAQAAALARELRHLGARSDLSALPAAYGDVQVVLLSCASSTPHPALRAWVAGAPASAVTAPIHVGAGRPADSVAGLRESVAQAVTALHLGRRIGGAARTFQYEDLGLERLLSGLRDQSELRRFCADTIGPLAAYDASHRTDLVSTLRTYLGLNGNASQAARALVVHRNTLAYRLRRIADLTGLNLDDAGARLTLQLALTLHRLG
jgi:purine catabolism regulator